MKGIAATILGVIVIVFAILFAVVILFPDIMKNEDKYLNNK